MDTVSKYRPNATECPIPRYQRHKKPNPVQPTSALDVGWLVLMILIVIMLSGCTGQTPAPETSPQPDSCEVMKQPVKLYDSKVAGLPIPFTDWRIGGLYDAEIIDAAGIPDIPSKVIAKGTIVTGLCWAAGLAFLLVPAGIFAGLYWKWGGGPLLSVTGFITSIVAAALAYWFDQAMWVLGAAFLAMVGAMVYLAFNRHKLKSVINELVDTGERMKHQDWTPELKIDLLKSQSQATAREVVRAKNEIREKTVRSIKNMHDVVIPKAPHMQPPLPQPHSRTEL